MRFGLPQQASENQFLLLSLLDSLPLQIGEFFDQFFHLLVVLDGLPHALFPLPRHEHLAQLPFLPSDQVQTGMQLPLGAMATGFATANIPQREGAAQKARGADDLGQARPLPTFLGGEV
jgi:hypothetical protein